jgi:hypothetical protein
MRAIPDILLEACTAMLTQLYLFACFVIDTL